MRSCNTYKALKRTRIVACVFCDKKFSNRFDCIVHNASHIVIPLWTQSLYKCSVCDNYTEDNIESHNNTHHPVKQNIKPNNTNGIKSQIKFNDTIEKHEISDYKELDENKINNNEPIRNRLKFEEDTNSIGSIDNLVTQCKVNVQIKEPLEFSEIKFHNCNKSCVINEVCVKSEVNDVSNERETVLEPAYKCIDYSSLMKPGNFTCQYCSMSHPNRFSLIKHEMCHIKISKAKPVLCLYCDKYIAGNYKTLSKHITKRHPNVRVKKSKTFKCKRCNLRFNKYKRHVKNYHIYDCPDCGLEMNDAEQHDSHMATCKCPNYKSKVLKVCDLCFSFMKRRVNLIYCLMGDTDNELGVRYPCENCGKKYFVLKMVKRLQKERKICYREHKMLTNKDRLKNIQHRMKKLNLLNKY